MVLEAGLRALTVIHQGATSNLWGLACPFYCTSPGVGALLACFLAGLILGSLGGAAALYYLLVRFPSPPDCSEAPGPRGEAQRPRGRPRLQAYVHG